MPCTGGPHTAARIDSILVSNPITDSAVTAAVEAALAAIGEAGDSASLKAARAAHAGENSPLAQLNAQIRDLPGDQKSPLEIPDRHAGVPEGGVGVPQVIERSRLAPLVT